MNVFIHEMALRILSSDIENEDDDDVGRWREREKNMNIAFIPSLIQYHQIDWLDDLVGRLIIHIV